MIMTTDELRKYITTEESDDMLTGRLAAMELMIRAYTHNRFQQRSVRRMGDIVGDLIIMEALQPFNKGDTVQVTDSDFNDGLYVVKDANVATITVDGLQTDENDVLITRVVYPMDVKMGVVNLIRWDMERRDKAGIQSETISRHSVTYASMDGENAIMGYPKSLIGFLRPYMRARFGQGARS